MWSVNETEMSRTARPAPAELTESWPDKSSTDEAGEVARKFVLNLLDATSGRSNRAIAKIADVDEGTIRRIIAGATWPDLRTISKLETALDRRLYPR